MKMNKTEILTLHTLSEEEQYAWLDKHNVRHQEPIGIRHIRWESIADCAFRLRDEVSKVCSSGLYDFDEQFYVICEMVNGDPDMWEYEAKAIHWIMAALLAKIKE